MWSSLQGYTKQNCNIIKSLTSSFDKPKIKIDYQSEKCFAKITFSLLFLFFLICTYKNSFS